MTFAGVHIASSHMRYLTDKQVNLIYDALDGSNEVATKDDIVTIANFLAALQYDLGDQEEITQEVRTALNRLLAQSEMNIE